MQTKHDEELTESKISEDKLMSRIADLEQSVKNTEEDLDAAKEVIVNKEQEIQDMSKLHEDQLVELQSKAQADMDQ